jgi:hypothetical protein
MALNTQGKDGTGGTSEDGATKRSYSNRDSTLQPDEDIAQIRKRVLEANNALRASGLAWSSEPEGEEAGDDEEEEEEESSEDGDEDDEEDESETNENGLPAGLMPAGPMTAALMASGPMAATTTHVWVLSYEQGDGYKNNHGGIRGVFRHFNDAVPAIIPEVRGRGFGVDKDDEMYFAGPKSFVDIAHKSFDISLKGYDSYSWRFEDADGQFMTVEIRRMHIQ